MNLRPLKYLSPAALGATVFRFRDRLARGPVELTTAVLAEKDWVNAKNMLGRVRIAIQDDIKTRQVPVVLGAVERCWIEQLPAGEFIGWVKGDPEPEKRLRFMVPLVTNPTTWIFSGGASVHMEVGMLWFVETLVLWSMVNFGEHPAVTFCAEFKIAEGA